MTRSFSKVLLVLSFFTAAPPQWIASAATGVSAAHQEVKLLASDGAAGDTLGVSVAISGERLVLGAHADDDLGVDSGSAYVFERDERGAWVEVAKLLASDGAAGDQFGVAVAISGETLVVGARLADAAALNSGAAYVFARDGAGAWGEAARLVASDGARGDLFGISVAISGERLVVGAFLDDDLGTNSGAAYVFAREESGAWSEVAKLHASDGAAFHQFGISVGMSGESLVVGASGDDDLGTNSGAAYVFAREKSGAWSEVAKLHASDGAAFDQLGIAVAISGERLVVGANLGDGQSLGSGAAYVFESDAGAWFEVAKLVASDGATDDDFAISVGVSGDGVIVGAPEDDDRGEGSGSAYLFQRDGSGAWAQVAKLVAPDAAAGDGFGLAVAASGEGLVVGAYLDDDLGPDSGSAWAQSSLTLSITGSCPGPATLHITGATPRGPVALLRGTAPGSFALPGRCTGTELGLADPRLLHTFPADPEGAVTLSPLLPPAACGAYLQALDLTSCGASNVARLP